jgi:hypothetical protein
MHANVKEEFIEKYLIKRHAFLLQIGMPVDASFDDGNLPLKLLVALDQFISQQVALRVAKM